MASGFTRNKSGTSKNGAKLQSDGTVSEDLPTKGVYLHEDFQDMWRLTAKAKDQLREVDRKIERAKQASCFIPSDPYQTENRFSSSPGIETPFYLKATRELYKGHSNPQIRFLHEKARKASKSRYLGENGIERLEAEHESSDFREFRGGGDFFEEDFAGQEEEHSDWERESQASSSSVDRVVLESNFSSQHQRNFTRDLPSQTGASEGGSNRRVLVAQKSASPTVRKTRQTCTEPLTSNGQRTAPISEDQNVDKRSNGAKPSLKHPRLFSLRPKRALGPTTQPLQTVDEQRAEKAREKEKGRVVSQMERIDRIRLRLKASKEKRVAAQANDENREAGLTRTGSQNITTEKEGTNRVRRTSAMNAERVGSAGAISRPDSGTSSSYSKKSTTVSTPSSVGGASSGNSDVKEPNKFPGSKLQRRLAPLAPSKEPETVSKARARPYDSKEIRLYMEKKRQERRKLLRSPPKERRIDKIRHYDQTTVQSYIKQRKEERKSMDRLAKKRKSEEKLERLEKLSEVLEKQKKRSKIPTRDLVLEGREIPITAPSPNKKPRAEQIVEEVRKKHEERKERFAKEMRLSPPVDTEKPCEVDLLPESSDNYFVEPIDRIERIRRDRELRKLRGLTTDNSFDGTDYRHDMEANPAFQLHNVITIEPNGYHEFLEMTGPSSGPISEHPSPDKTVTGESGRFPPRHVGGASERDQYNVARTISRKETEGKECVGRPPSPPERSSSTHFVPAAKQHSNHVTRHDAQIQQSMTALINQDANIRRMTRIEEDSRQGTGIVQEGDILDISLGSDKFMRRLSLSTERSVDHHQTSVLSMSSLTSLLNGKHDYESEVDVAGFGDVLVQIEPESSRSSVIDELEVAGEEEQTDGGLQNVQAVQLNERERSIGSVSPSGLQLKFTAGLNYLLSVEEQLKRVGDLVRMGELTDAQHETIAAGYLAKAREAELEESRMVNETLRTSVADGQTLNLPSTSALKPTFRAQSPTAGLDGSVGVAQASPTDSRLDETHLELIRMIADAGKKQNTNDRELAKIASEAAASAATAAVLTVMKDRQKIVSVRHDVSSERSSSVSSVRQTGSPSESTRQSTKRTDRRSEKMTKKRKATPSEADSRTPEITEELKTAEDSSVGERSGSVIEGSGATAQEGSTEEDIKEETGIAELSEIEENRSVSESIEESSSAQETTTRSGSWKEEKSEFGSKLVRIARNLVQSSKKREDLREHLVSVRRTALKNYFAAQIAVLHAQKNLLTSTADSGNVEIHLENLRKKKEALKAKQDSEQLEVMASATAVMTERDFIGLQLKEIGRLQALTMQQDWELEMIGQRRASAIGSSTDLANGRRDEAEAGISGLTKANIEAPLDSNAVVLEELEKLVNPEAERDRLKTLAKRKKRAEKMIRIRLDFERQTNEVRRIQEEALRVWQTPPGHLRKRLSIGDRSMKKKSISDRGSDQRSEESSETTSRESTRENTPRITEIVEKGEGSKSISEDLPSNQSSQSAVIEEIVSIVSIAKDSSVPTAEKSSISEELPETQKSSEIPTELDTNKESSTIGTKETGSGTGDSASATGKTSSEDSSSGTETSKKTVKEQNLRRISWPLAPSKEESLDFSLSSETNEMEGRIRALRSELQDRKKVAFKLKAEYELRTKEHLLVTEQSLIRQLENHQRFIDKKSSQLADLEQLNASGVSLTRPATPPRILSPRPQSDSESVPGSPRRQLRSPVKTLGGGVLPSKDSTLVRSRSSSLSDSQQLGSKGVDKSRIPVRVKGTESKRSSESVAEESSIHTEKPSSEFASKEESVSEELPETEEKVVTEAKEPDQNVESTSISDQIKEISNTESSGADKSDEISEQTGLEQHESERSEGKVPMLDLAAIKDKSIAGGVLEIEEKSRASDTELDRSEVIEIDGDSGSISQESDTSDSGSFEPENLEVKKAAQEREVSVKESERTIESVPEELETEQAESPLLTESRRSEDLENIEVGGQQEAEEGDISRKKEESIRGEEDQRKEYDHEQEADLKLKKIGNNSEEKDVITESVQSVEKENKIPSPTSPRKESILQKSKSETELSPKLPTESMKESPLREVQKSKIMEPAVLKSPIDNVEFQLPNGEELDLESSKMSTSTAEDDRRTENDVSSLTDTEITPRRTPRALEIFEGLLTASVTEIARDARREGKVEGVTEEMLGELLTEAVTECLDVVNRGTVLMMEDSGTKTPDNIRSPLDLKKHDEALEEDISHKSPRSQSSGSPRSPVSERFMAIYREPHHSLQKENHKHGQTDGSKSPEADKLALGILELEEPPIEEEWMDDDFGLSTSSGSPKDTTSLGELSAKSPKSPRKLSLDLGKFTTDVFSAVPSSDAAVAQLVEASAEKIWEQRRYGESIWDAEPPASLYAVGPGRSLTGAELELSLNKESDKAYREFIFSWTKEIATEIFECFEQLEQNAERLPWQKAPRLKTSRYSKWLPRSAGELSNIVNGVMRGKNQGPGREKIVSRKKLDKVDAILLAEMYEEEADWLDYDKEEEEVKMEMAEAVWKDLLNEAVVSVANAYIPKQ